MSVPGSHAPFTVPPPRQPRRWPRLLRHGAWIFAVLGLVGFGARWIHQARSLRPEAERRSFVLAPGFRAELVACEPLVRDPVALAFAPDGRLWVCEMQGYMPDATGQGEGGPIGRVVVLEDTDGDGRMDKSTVFLDGLVLPRAIALVRDGVLVAEPPHLWFCRDRDGDGRADEKIEVDPRYTLTSITSPEHMANGLRWAMDNWIYNAKSATRYRLQPDGTFERSATAFRGQWGLDQDDWGRLFYNYNGMPLRADTLPSASYLERNPRRRISIGINESVVKDQRVWPVRETPGIGSAGALKNGRLAGFTAACGPAIYRGELFPPEYRGNAFVCEPAGNLIKRFILREAGNVLSGENAVEGREFLASTDERFRPVNLYTGPDGALWVVDMYRGVIEHSSFMSRALRSYIQSRGLDRPIGMGRIWRIVPDDTKTGPLPKLAARSIGDLVAALGSPNGWQRDTAQRLLVERQDRAAAGPLQHLLEKGATAPTRLHALHTLNGLGELDTARLTLALRDPESRVRAAAIHLSEARLENDPPLREAVLAMTADHTLAVRLQLMLTLGALPGSEPFPAMLQLLTEPGIGDLYLQEAALSGLGGRELPFLHEFFRSPASAPTNGNARAMILGVTESVIAGRAPAQCEELLRLIADQHPSWRHAYLLNALGRIPGLSPGVFRPIGLPREPEAWAELAAHSDRKTLGKVGELFSWPGKPSPLEPQRTPLNAEEQRLFEIGKQIYAQTCAACHQPDGRGQEGLAPPVLDSEWVLGGEQQLVRIVLHGVAGQMNVRGRIYNMEMPAFGAAFDDGQIAAVLTYLRREWGHPTHPVAPSTVEAIRAKTRKREQPWSARALRNLKAE